MEIKVLGVDGALKNFGFAKGEIDLATLAIAMTDLALTRTEKSTIKTVRRNSDDLVRARSIAAALREHAAGRIVAFAEIPSGAQSARAALSFGMVIGLMANCPIPLIEVQPSETKLATVGTKTASKEEMIEWAVTTYPHLPWLTRKFKGEIQFVDHNEHLADACAVIHAGVKTEQFKQLAAIWRAAPAVQPLAA